MHGLVNIQMVEKLTELETLKKLPNIKRITRLLLSYNLWLGKRNFVFALQVVKLIVKKLKKNIKTLLYKTILFMKVMSMLNFALMSVLN